MPRSQKVRKATATNESSWHHEVLTPDVSSLSNASFKKRTPVAASFKMQKKARKKPISKEEKTLTSHSVTDHVASAATNGQMHLYNSSMSIAYAMPFGGTTAYAMPLSDAKVISTAYAMPPSADISTAHVVPLSGESGDAKVSSAYGMPLSGDVKVAANAGDTSSCPIVIDSDSSSDDSESDSDSSDSDSGSDSSGSGSDSDSDDSN